MNPTLYLNFAIQLFQRNNPIEMVVASFQQWTHMLKNYNSNAKLNKFRHGMYVQQMKRMERYLSEGSPYQHQGIKMDRRF